MVYEEYRGESIFSSHILHRLKGIETYILNTKKAFTKKSKYFFEFNKIQ